MVLCYNRHRKLRLLPASLAFSQFNVTSSEKCCPISRTRQLPARGSHDLCVLSSRKPSQHIFLPSPVQLLDLGLYFSLDANSPRAGILGWADTTPCSIVSSQLCLPHSRCSTNVTGRNKRLYQPAHPSADPTESLNLSLWFRVNSGRETGP